MGEVYRARDAKLGRDVAIKSPAARVHERPDRLARFEREARMLAALNHPNICAHLRRSKKRMAIRFLVLELVEGETLAARIARRMRPARGTACPCAEALTIARQIAEALEVAHETGSSTAT